MKLQAELGNEKHEIEITRDGKMIFAAIDGREYKIETSEAERNVFLLKNDGRIYDADVTSDTVLGNQGIIKLNGREFNIRIIDPKRLRGTGSGGSSHSDGLTEIRTAMPGKLVRIILEIGDKVEKGDGVLVVEAMKMQNELKSPKTGIIKDIRVSEGATVASGDILAIIE